MGASVEETHVRQYLVVANQTLGHAPLLERILACHRAEPSSFHLLVPATDAQDHDRWTRGEATAMAGRRLVRALDHLRGCGVAVHGEVGDPSPLVAIGAALRQRSFDELIISTLPERRSRWLRAGLPERIEALFGVPVIHVSADLAGAQP
ncbi:MAG: hypothetical protein ACRDY7_16985 [Acidimicrobiia bacterium]